MQRNSKTNCCVVGCNNAYCNTDATVKFYNFPNKWYENERKKIWVDSIRRVCSENSKKPWQPKPHARICSMHFVGNKKSNHPQNPAYNPTIFPKRSDSKRSHLCTSSTNFQQASDENDAILPPIIPTQSLKRDFSCQIEFQLHDNSDDNSFIFESNFIGITQEVATQCQIPLSKVVYLSQGKDKCVGTSCKEKNFEEVLLDMDNTGVLWNFHKCKLCTYRTRYLHCIRNHVSKHRMRLKDHQFICHSYPPEQYQYEKCRFQLHQKVLLTRHFNTIHKSDKTGHYQNPVQRFCEKNCPFQTYSLLVLLKHHIRSHGTENQMFQSQNENCEVEKEKNFQCSRCFYKATLWVNMKNHVVSKHTPEEEMIFFKCEYCSYKAKFGKELRSHMLTQHKSAKEIL